MEDLKFRDSLYQTPVGRSVEDRIRSVEKHEQGGKVQFVFNSGNGLHLNNNQTWDTVGFLNYGGNSISPASNVNVLVPDDVTINDANVYIWMAPTDYYTSVPVHSYRQAATMRLYYYNNFGTPGFSTYLHYPYLSEGEQRYGYDPVSVSYNSKLNISSIFSSFSEYNSGDSSLNPVADGAVKYVYAPLTVTGSDAHIVAGVPRVFNLAGDGAVIEYFSICFVQIIVNGYTKNR